MPAALTYPGIYVEEIPSAVRTITGVSTSNTAFIDFFARGTMNTATRITSYGDFARAFGGLDLRSEASYAIQQFYLNGGQIGWVVRVAAGAPEYAYRGLTAAIGSGSQKSLTVSAISQGLWGNNLQVAIDYNTKDANQFNLAVREVALVNGQKRVVQNELLRNLSMDKTSSRYAVDVVNNSSGLIRLVEPVGGAGARPDVTTTATTLDITLSGVISDPSTGDATIPDPANPSGPQISNPNRVFYALGDPVNLAANGLPDASDGQIPDAIALSNGLAALDAIAPEIFNILCLPAAANLDAQASGFPTPQLNSVLSAAEAYCTDKRAFLIVDIPAYVKTPANMSAWIASNEPAGIRSTNAAVYFPRLQVVDPLNEGRPRNVGVSGTLAGLYAANDSRRGVWKAPAGTEVSLRGATLDTKITDLEDGALNPFGINALRTFPVYGSVVWGARTLDGADQQASEWKYIPVRRTALYIEESLFEGLKWVVFEPNDEPLWAQIRLNVGAFMQNLFRQGAFQGNTPSKAYLVKCDSETTTQNDIDLGIVNIVVGFAPLKPAEFVVLQIQQLAGQLDV